MYLHFGHIYSEMGKKTSSHLEIIYLHLRK